MTLLLAGLGSQHLRFCEDGWNPFVLLGVGTVTPRQCSTNFSGSALSAPHLAPPPPPKHLVWSWKEGVFPVD